MSYTVYHLHTHLSNGTTTLDSVTDYKRYIEMAKSQGMTALAFSEHGSVFEWLHKKEAVEKAGMKYIHGIEAYTTEGGDEKKRDNYHLGLYAKNYEGFKEINKLSSISFDRTDEKHYYHNPRITLEEIYATSDNVIITTACLGGLLHKCDDNGVKNKFIDFLRRNKHRCFLEVQHHIESNQIGYNQYLHKLSKLHDIPLIAGTDTHAIDNLDLETRLILQKCKNINFENEEAWNIKWLSYDELVAEYEKQNSLPMDVVLEAIQNTNVLADMVEEIKLDKSFKYPQLFDDPEQVMRERFKEGYVRRNIADKPNVQEYNDRIKYEMEIYRKQDAVNFLLLEENIKTAMAKKGVYPGYARGSASGSLIAYILGIVETDSVKWNLYFERFMNPERVSLADIDTDYSPEDIPIVKSYVHNDLKEICPTLSTAEIITFNTNAVKGAMRDIHKGLTILSKEGSLDKLGLTEHDIPSSMELHAMSADVEDNLDRYSERWHEFFQYVNRAIGVVMSVGSHPAGTVVSPIPLDEEMGTFTSKTNQYPISQLNMKEIDSLNYVKLDILGLDNVGIMNYACKLAGIERLTPDNMDFKDDKVWENMVKDPIGIFQFESDYAFSLLKKALSPETIAKAKAYYEGVSRLDITGIISAGIRPGGKSYINELVVGDVHDNKHEALNELLGFTFGYLVFQESIIEFLNKFCGFTLGQADMIRRGFAKKSGTEQYIPQIKKGFIETMAEQYNTPKEDAEDIAEYFLQVIEDASDYVFSWNHALPYSMLGYAVAYLRTYYPLEFMTSLLHYNQDNLDKTAKIVEYINNFTDVKIASVTFGKSKSGYYCDKETNTIYKGVSSIKGIGQELAENIYLAYNPTHKTFMQVLQDMSSISVNNTQLTNLIRLGFFRQYGEAQYLLFITDVYNSLANAKVIAKGKLPQWESVIEKHSRATEKQYRDIDIDAVIAEILEDMPKIKDFTLKEQLQHQLECMGYVDLIFESADKKLFFVEAIQFYKDKSKPVVQVYNIKTGKRLQLKITKSNVFSANPFDKGGLLSISKVSKKGKNELVNGKWKKSKTVFDFILDEYDVY